MIGTGETDANGEVYRIKELASNIFTGNGTHKFMTIKSQAK